MSQSNFHETFVLTRVKETIVYPHLGLEEAQYFLGNLPQNYKPLVDEPLLEQSITHDLCHNNHREE